MFHTQPPEALNFVFYMLCVIGWLFGIFTAARARNYKLFVIDFLIFPVGIVHGWRVMLRLLLRLYDRPSRWDW